VLWISYLYINYEINSQKLIKNIIYSLPISNHKIEVILCLNIYLFNYNHFFFIILKREVIFFNNLLTLTKVVYGSNIENVLLKILQNKTIYIYI